MVKACAYSCQHHLWRHAGIGDSVNSTKQRSRYKIYVVYYGGPLVPHELFFFISRSRDPDFVSRDPNLGIPTL